MRPTRRRRPSIEALAETPVHRVVMDYPESLSVFLGRQSFTSDKAASSLGELMEDDPLVSVRIESAVAWRPSS